MENKTYNFTCTACGGCCNKSPSMNVYDMLELSDEFIFQVSHHTMISKTSQPIDKNLIEHYQTLGHTLVLPEFDAVMFYWIDFSSVVSPSYKNCPKLIDNKCSIYHKRPNNCKLQPFNYRLPENLQFKEIEFYEQKTIKKEWNCSFAETDPLLFKDSHISSNHQNSLYYNNLYAIKDFTDKYIESMNQYDNRQQDHFKTVFKTCLAKSYLVTDIIQPLFVLINYNVIGIDFAYKIVNNQLKLIKIEIERATRLKIKDDVKYSRLYKKIEENYEKALKNKIFNNNEYDELNLIG